MPFTNSDIEFSWNPTIRNPGNTSTHRLDDEIDWNTVGSMPIDPTNVEWNVTIIYPNTIQVGATFNGNGNSGELGFPVDSQGNPMKGQYRFRVNIEIVGPVDAGQYTLEDDIGEYCPENVIPAFQITDNCTGIAPIVVGTDVTTYPTGSTIDSRTVELHSPEPGLAPYSGVGPSVNSGTDSAYRGVWRMTLSTMATVGSLTTDGQTVTTTYLVTENNNNKTVASASKDVQCKDLCEIYCLVSKAYARWEALGCKDFNSPEYLDWQKAQSEFNAALIELNDCGNSTEYQKHVGNLYLLTNSTEGCNCGSGDDSDYIPVIGNGSAVTSVTGQGYVIANPTTGAVMVTLTQAATDILNNTYNTIVTSTNLQVSQVTNVLPTPDEVTYTVNAPANITGRDSIEFLLEFTNLPTGSGAVPTTSISAEVIKGDATFFQGATITPYGGSGANVARFQVSDFDAGSLPVTWKATAEFQDPVFQNNYVTSYINNGYSANDTPIQFECQVVNTNTAGPAFDVSIYTKNNPGSPNFWYSLQNQFVSFTLKIRISI